MCVCVCKPNGFHRRIIFCFIMYTFFCERWFTRFISPLLDFVVVVRMLNRNESIAYNRLRNNENEKKNRNKLCQNVARAFISLTVKVNLQHLCCMYTSKMSLSLEQRETIDRKKQVKRNENVKVNG